MNLRFLFLIAFRWAFCLLTGGIFGTGELELKACERKVKLEVCERKVELEVWKRTTGMTQFSLNDHVTTSTISV